MRLDPNILRGFRRTPPQDVHKVISNGASGAQWIEGNRTLTGQVWSEAPTERHVWLLLAEGNFPGEMREAERVGGKIKAVGRTVYDAHGRNQSITPVHANGSEPAIQAAFEFDGMPEKPPPMPETMPLF